jgi:fluoroacetyl-CoA thioesterase
VNVKGELTEVDGRKLTFSIVAHDGIDLISEGTHQRYIVDAERFIARVEKKAKPQ